MNAKVSIIIPIYNVEQYIAECVHSLFKQTYPNIEFIFVDDASPDNSVSILKKIIEKYNNRKEQVILIRKEQNVGSSQARKAGFEVCTGNYIICADSDDWLELNMIEEMVNKAVSEDIDIVWCDYFKNDKHIIKDCPKTGNKVEIFKALLNGDSMGSLCNKLVKRKIYLNDIYFPKAMMLEDFVICTQILIYAEKIEFLNTALYHYRTNPDSLSCSKPRQAKIIIESYENLAWAIKFLENKFGNDLELLEPYLSSRINYIKIDIMRTKETRDIKELYDLYPKSLSLKTAIKYKKPVILAQIIVLFFAKKNILFPYRLFSLLREKYMKKNRKQ